MSLHAREVSRRAAIAEGTALGSFLSARVKRLERSPFAVIALSLFLVGFIGAFDYLTPPNVTLSPIYLIPIALSSWYLGPLWGSLMAAISVAVWVGGDLAAGDIYTELVMPAWNALLRFIFYLAVVWLLVNLRALQRDLEDRVAQRTSALRQEMAERSRLEQELLEISEREQRRIGQDVHDSLCQHLTGTALAGQAIVKRLSSVSSSAAAEVNRLVLLIEQGIMQSRQLARGLHPVDSEADGLMRALESFCEGATELFGTRCRFECENPVLLDDTGAAVNLFRIAQEAVGNALKHGKATEIVVTLNLDDTQLLLEVRDDGIGVPEPLPATGGMGFRIMAYRARMIGARLEIGPGACRGTCVRCILPNEREQLS